MEQNGDDSEILFYKVCNISMKEKDESKENKNMTEEKGHKLYSIEQCELHNKAHILGQSFRQSEVCKCCNMPYEKLPINCTFSNQQIQYLGQGHSLYFQFMKMCLIISLLSILTCSIPNIVLNSRGQGCVTFQSQFKCSKTIFSEISVANKLSEDFRDFRIQNYLIILPIVTIFIIIQLFRKRFQIIEESMEHLAGPQNYSLIGSIYYMTENQERYTSNQTQVKSEVTVAEQKIVGKSSLQKQIENAIYQWFRQEEQLNYKELKEMQKNDEKIEIQKIIISYDISQSKELVDELAQIQEEAVICQFESENYESLRKIEEKLQEIKRKVKSIRVKRTNKFIAIFSYEKFSKYMIDVVNRNSLLTVFKYEHQFHIGGRPVKIQNCPLPSQILWENHHIKKQMKLLKRILVYILFLIVLVAGQSIIFVVLYFFWYIIVSPTEDEIQQYISGLISAFMVLINFILYYFFIFISRFEYRVQTDYDQISKCIKIIFTIFLNSGILLFCAYYIIQLPTLWVYNGFVDTLSYTFIYSIFTPHLFKYINLENAIKAFYYIRIKYFNPRYSQRMANVRYQRPEGMEVYHYYAWQVTMLWLSSFFASMAPLGFLCVFVSFLLHYVLERLNFAYLYKERKPWGSKLNNVMIDMVQFSEFLLIIGNVVTGIVIRQTHYKQIDIYPFLINIILGVILLLHIFFLPKNAIVKLLTCFYCRKKEETKSISYKERKQKFISTFEQERRLKYDGKNTKIELLNEKAVKLDLMKRIQKIKQTVKEIEGKRKEFGKAVENTQMFINSQNN